MNQMPILKFYFDEFGEKKAWEGDSYPPIILWVNTTFDFRSNEPSPDLLKLLIQNNLS
jgi:hypothetical protein